jgi:hypothetical protein
MELHKVRLAFGVDQAVTVHAEAFHHGKRARNSAIAHDPHQHVHRLRRERYEIVESIVRGRGLWDLVVGLRLDRMNQVRKFDRVLNEENRDVVSDQIPVALLGVHLHGETAHVACGIGRAARAGHGGKANENRRFKLRVGQDVAVVYFESESSYTWKNPWAAAPRACTTRSGIRS